MIPPMVPRRAIKAGSREDRLQRARKKPVRGRWWCGTCRKQQHTITGGAGSFICAVCGSPLQTPEIVSP